MSLSNQFDFLAVTERMMDESVVALQLLLGLNVGDVQVGGAHLTIMEKNEAASRSKTKPMRRQWSETISNPMKDRPSLTVTIVSTRLRIEASWT